MKWTVKSCGPDALAAGVSSQHAMACCGGGDKQAQSRRGEHEVSRNPSRRESRDVPGYTCGPTPELSTFARGPWVRSAPGFPCALCSTEGGTKSKARTNHVARMRSYVPTLTVIARLDRAIQYAAASRLKHRSLWNTGSPACASDDTAVADIAFAPRNNDGNVEFTN
jgi:hypothetical protein